MNRGALLCLMVLALTLSSAKGLAAQVAAASVKTSIQSPSANKNILRVQSSQYFSSGANFYRDGASSENSSLSLFLDREDRLFAGFAARTDLKNEYSATENWNYLNVYQLYAHKQVRGVTLAFGRKLESWSRTDDEWKQGVFQSRYMQNKMKAEPAGLVGFFANGQTGRSVAWSVGVLPLYVPDISAHFSTENHQFVSRNPWFKPPASSVPFKGQELPVRYRVNQPPTNEIVANPGLIAKVESEFKNSGFRVSGAYKPVPQLLLGFPSLNRVIVGANEDYLHVEITPKVMYHWVAATEGWAQLGRWSLGAGLTHDRTIGDAFGADFTSQRYSPAWIWSLSATRALQQEGPRAARIKFGAIKIAGGAKPDSGEFGSARSLFEKRFQYDEAYMAGIVFPLRGWFRQPLETEAKVVYDRLQNGGSLSLAAGYSPAPGWRIDGEVDVIGLVSPAAQVENGFFSNYRANDRVGVGTSYVF